MKKRFKDTKTTVKVIGLYQIIGGILGILLSCWLIINTGEINGPTLFIYCLALFLFGFSIKAGNILLQPKNFKKGIVYSLILQGLQIFAVSVGNYSFDFYSGVRGAIGFEFSEGFQFIFRTSFSGFYFSLNSDQSMFFLKVNLIAFMLFYILLDLYDEEKEKKKQLISSDL